KELRLSIGVHTGFGVIATFESSGRTHNTILGAETGNAARLAATAAAGSILVSPETYALVQDELLANPDGCLLMEEFHDSDLAHATITPTPSLMSTFAGLG